MSRILMPLAVIAALSLSACAPMPPPGPMPPPAGACNAQDAHWAIGQAATADVVERVRFDTNSQIVRVVEPGQPVTMDYSPSRVNISVNERGAIVGITCG